MNRFATSTAAPVQAILRLCQVRTKGGNSRRSNAPIQNTLIPNNFFIGANRRKLVAKGQDYYCSNVSMRLTTPTEVESRIGNIIAGLVTDGCTLQMGIGAIPNAVLAELKNHKDLGIYTEMFQEGVIPLIENGVVINLRKTFLLNKILTSFILGTKRLYDFVDDNPSVHFADASIANNPTIIASNPKGTAINSAVEVDLSGQVCADSVGHRMISGVGGQVDFKGEPPYLLENCYCLKSGGGVSTSRPHVHYIVTEWGYAFLFGKNLQQRAKALIEIAHPAHRAQLEKEAYEYLGIQPWRD
ncbi:UNVERIFIED_CONTAM: hypothetical protein HDU68_002122 [Siphonaria sp. JEL0065]|nr:hypothetical protein HDU68_002122 [Siphonaria sp. JEL0065]